MLKNYLLLAYRNLVANKLTSFINIVGLSISVASAIAVFLILRNFWTLDDFHANGDRIFMVEYTTETDGETLTFGDAPAPIAAALWQFGPTTRSECTGAEPRHGRKILSRPKSRWAAICGDW